MMIWLLMFVKHDLYDFKYTKNKLLSQSRVLNAFLEAYTISILQLFIAKNIFID